MCEGSPKVCLTSLLPCMQVWLRVLKYRLSQGDSEGARKTLDRSLQSLPKFEHIRMISQAALLEFKMGDPGGWAVGGRGVALFLVFELGGDEGHSSL